MDNLLAGPPPTLLPRDEAAAAALAAGVPAAQVAADHPADSQAWAQLAEEALVSPEVASTIAGYAYARTGYHRGLDALRRHGWKGYGPVPADHPGNAGFLRALQALGQAAARIGEQAEAERVHALLADCDPSLR